jgi:FtsZ-binding cell division protein ZapB
VQGEFAPVDLPSYSAVNNNELYNLEIRELRTKIEVLEQEKTALYDRIRALQQNNVFSGQETVELYRAEINSLR